MLARVKSIAKERSAERSPPPVRPLPAVSVRVVATLLLKVVKSAEARSPRFEAEADGKLKVKTFPEPVTVKSVPVVELAIVIDGPVCTCPVGPTPVRDPLPRHEPLTKTQPELKTIPLAKVELAVELVTLRRLVAMPPV